MRAKLVSIHAVFVGQQRSVKCNVARCSILSRCSTKSKTVHKSLNHQKAMSADGVKELITLFETVPLRMKPVILEGGSLHQVMSVEPVVVKPT
jgi:hypothetical protein